MCVFRSDKWLRNRDLLRDTETEGFVFVLFCFVLFFLWCLCFSYTDWTVVTCSLGFSFFIVWYLVSRCVSLVQNGLKGNRWERTNCPQNVKNVQIFSSAGFVQLCSLSMIMPLTYFIASNLSCSELIRDGSKRTEGSKEPLTVSSLRRC